MEGPASHPETKPAESCFDRTFSALTVDNVYEIAKLIGTEVEKLIDGYGKDSVEGLVPKIVKVLELLESFASRNHAHKLREEELLKTFETIQLQQQKKRAGKESDEGKDKNEIQELQQKEQQWKRRCEELQVQVQQLQVDREELQSRLKGSHAQEDRVQRQEREVMLKLKEVVDKQRDELRAKVQEISTISKEVEALQEQLDRFMKMNAELRHKQNVLQAQLKSTVERKADMEADLKEKTKEIENLQAQLDRTNSNNPVCMLLTDYYCYLLLLLFSDEEDKSPLFGQTEVDGTEVDSSDKPAESRIRNLFGFLTRSGSGRSPTHMSNSASSWEIIGDSEANEERDQRPFWVFGHWCGDEASPQSSECSALLLAVLLTHTGPCWEERLPESQACQKDELCVYPGVCRCPPGYYGAQCKTLDFCKMTL
eukprot:superscaffoldBa00000629_g6184